MHSSFHLRDLKSNSRKQGILSLLKYLAIVQEPTAGDIARALGLSPSTVSYHLKKLEDAGLVLIDKSGRKARVRALATADSPGYSS